MKRFVGILLFCLICLSLYAENGTVVLINRRSSWFYYCLDPEGMQGDVKPSVQDINNGNVTFFAVGPQSTQKIDALTPGTHYLLGFWRTTDKEQVPVLSKRFQINADEIIEFDLAQETYKMVVKESGEQTTAAVTVVPGRIVIDNNYDDWKVIPSSAVFSPGFIPDYFKKQSLTGVNYVPIKHSLFWGKGGTAINQVKLYRNDGYLYVYISSYSRMTVGLSYYFYLFKSRAVQEKNKYTIELVVDDMADTSKVILWQKDRKNYTVIGELKCSSFYLEARIQLDKLPVPISEIVNYYSIDLTSSYYDNRLKIYEEFFFTTLYGKDIITKADLKIH